jgi:hypothetical protein
MNAREAAQQANVTIATVRTWCRCGAIEAVKISGRWTIDAASLAYRISIGRASGRNDDFDTAINIEVAEAGDRGSVAGLRSILGHIETRNVSAFITPGARIPESQWADAEGFVRSEIAALTSERRTRRAIYDYA